MPGAAPVAREGWDHLPGRSRNRCGKDSLAPHHATHSSSLQFFKLKVKYLIVYIYLYRERDIYIYIYRYRKNLKTSSCRLLVNLRIISSNSPFEWLLVVSPAPLGPATGPDLRVSSRCSPNVGHRCPGHKLPHRRLQHFRTNCP